MATHKPLRVLYVNHMSTPAGCVRSLALLLKSLPLTDVEAHVLTPLGRAADELRESGARILPIDSVSLFQNIAGLPVRGVRWGTLLRAVWQMRHDAALREALRTVAPDLVHLNEHGMHHAAAVAHHMRLPVLMHVRCIADRESWWQKPTTTSLMRRYVDQVVAIDESVRWSIREIPDVRVIYNPVENCGEFDANPKPLPTAPVRVTFLAGLADFKGVFDLIEAARLLRHRTDIVFRIYGENRWSPDYYRSSPGKLGVSLGVTRDFERELREIIAREKLSDTVELMGYVRPSADLFRETDILAFPSHLNGVGRSVLEAGLCGIPSVVSLKDKIEDIVEDGVTGLIVDERDPSALAGAIERLADHPELRNRMGKHAAERYREMFDCKAVGQRMLTLYRELLSRPRA